MVDAKATGGLFRGFEKILIGRAFPEEGQAWGILLSEPEYDKFKELTDMEKP